MFSGPFRSFISICFYWDGILVRVLIESVSFSLQVPQVIRFGEAVGGCGRGMDCERKGGCNFSIGSKFI